MGWLFPLLVWDMPSSSTCGKGPAHQENRKMRLVKKLNIIMHFFVGVLVFSFIFFYYYFLYIFLYFWVFHTQRLTQGIRSRPSVQNVFFLRFIQLNYLRIHFQIFKYCNYTSKRIIRTVPSLPLSPTPVDNFLNIHLTKYIIEHKRCRI